MILFTTLVCFLFVFFSILSIVKIIRAQEEELRAKIEDRLKNGNSSITSVRIEKRERLSDLPALDRFLRKITQLKALQNFINQSGLQISVGSFILFSLVFGAIVFFTTFLFRGNAIFSFSLTFGLLVLPYLYIVIKRSQRLKRFSDYFPDALDVMSSSLRAGHSLQMAIEAVVEEGKDVVAAEFGKVISEMEIGQGFEEALKGMLDRVDTQDLRLFISAVVLQRETGGNLAELLDGLEEVIRERQEMRRELKSATAQARLSGTVLSLLPVFVGFFVFAIKPDYILFFFRDPVGIKMLMLCVVGQTLGVFSINRIVNMEV